jgi:hypothetical protein
MIPLDVTYTVMANEKLIAKLSESKFMVGKSLL